MERNIEKWEKEIILWEGRNKKGIEQDIYYNIAPPGYYMGDPYYKDGNKFNYSNIVLRSMYKDGSVEGDFISEKNFLKSTRLRLSNGNVIPRLEISLDNELFRTADTLDTNTEEDSVVIYKNDRNVNQLVLELSESGKVKKRYVRGNDLVFMDEGNGTEKKYYVTDPHGSVVQLTDENGKVTKTYEYDSFGNEVKPDKKDENPFRYCGEYYDKETEEIYLRARCYQPKMGRFLTRDTYTGEEDEPASLHLYTYCGNDGVNSIDPSGHASGSNKKLKDYYSAMGTGNTLWTRKYIYEGNRGGEWIDYENGGKVYKSPFLNNLKVCTDGKVTKKMKKTDYYNDNDHDPDNTTSCFGGKVSADEIPYIVVPPSKTSYKYSSGVIVNRLTGDYLYCVVAEVGPGEDDFGNTKKHMDEVSIYAAWKMYELGVPKKTVKKKHKIASDSPEGGPFQIISFMHSSPKPKEKNKKFGWKYNKNPKVLRKQIKQIGKRHYRGSGKCLN